MKSRACATREQYIGRPPPRPARGGGICHAVRRASGGSPAARFAPRRDRSSSAPRSVEFRTEIGPEHTFFRRCSAFGAGAQLPRRRPTACGTDAYRDARGPGCRRPAGGRPQRPRRRPPRLGPRPGPGRIDVRQNDIGRPNPRDASGEPRDCKDLSDTCGALSLQCHSDGHPVPGVRLTRSLMLRRRPGGRDTGPDDVLFTQSHGAKERRIRLSRIVTVPAACRPSRRRSPISARNRTDLEPEVDRSRCGIRPISTRGRRGPRATGAGPAHPGPGPRPRRCDRARGDGPGPSSGTLVPGPSCGVIQ